MTPEEKKDKIAFHMGQILESLGLDLTNPSLAKTPTRVAKMYVDEIFSGLDPTTYPSVSLYDALQTQELVLIKNIALTSTCEHHLVPMMGIAHIAYLPKKGVVGFSTIQRILHHFAKRPQLQERLTEEIAIALIHALCTQDVAVAIQMKHFCMLTRGIEDQRSEVETFVFKGKFDSDGSFRSDLLNRLKSWERG